MQIETVLVMEVDLGARVSEQVVNAKVLVVDDQPTNLIVATRILAKLPVEVFTANSGRAAMALVLRHKFAVILMDVRMPDMDGYETATLIREHTADDPVPIVFVTAGERDEESMAGGYASGPVDFLYKPIDATLLLSKVGVFVELHQLRQKLRETTIALRDSHQRLARLLKAAQ